MARSIRAAGGRSTGIVHVAYGYGLFTGGLGAHYGAEALGEAVVPRRGLPAWDEHFGRATIDPHSGTRLPDGADGELFLPSLTKSGMPVIRFRTRGRARLLPGAGRTVRRVARITGGSGDML